jgi:hypothetical protein
VPASCARLPRAVAALCLCVALACGCTRRYSVPKEKAPCAESCAREQSGCVSGCAVDKGNPQVLEDIRGNLCEKRCKEGYETCMLACL